MEHLYLGYETAKWYWEHAKCGAQILRDHPTQSTLCGCVTTPAAARRIAQGTPFENVPLHILTDKPFSRNDEGTRFHVNKGPFPKGAFIQVSSQLFVASPQLSFIQTAKNMPLGQVFLYEEALCGAFAIAEDSKYGINERAPLATAKQLQRYTQACGGMTGAKQARQVAALLVDGSASPRESMALGALTLPLRHGGWGLPGARLNHRIEIPQRFSWPGQRKYFVADLYWPDAKIALEYDSDVEHAHRVGIYRDSLKRNTLIDMGYTPICVTSIQLNNPSELAHVAETIRRALGKQKRKPSDNFAAAQAQLRRELGLPWFDRW